MNCSECGAAIEGSTKFCTSCGARIEPSPGAAAAPAAAAPASSAKPKHSSKLGLMLVLLLVLLVVTGIVGYWAFLSYQATPPVMRPQAAAAAPSPVVTPEADPPPAVAAEPVPTPVAEPPAAAGRRREPPAPARPQESPSVAPPPAETPKPSPLPTLDEPADEAVAPPAPPVSATPAENPPAARTPRPRSQILLPAGAAFDPPPSPVDSSGGGFRRSAGPDTSLAPSTPTSGDLFWSGPFKKNAVVTVSANDLQGAALPGRAVTVQTFSPAVEVVEQPGPGNGYKSFSFRCLRSSKRSVTVNFRWTAQ